MSKAKKVYCKDCKFLCSDGCHRTIYSDKPSEFIDEKRYILNDRERYNSKGKCPYYHRKWYKFWIKGS